MSNNSGSSSYQEQFRAESPEDLSEIFVEKSSDEAPKSVSATDLTKKLDGDQSWQPGSDHSDDTDSKGFKLWRPNANRYHKF